MPIVFHSKGEKTMKKRKKIFQHAVEKIAIKVAKMDANTACPCISYQPELPKAVKKLRKS